MDDTAQYDPYVSGDSEVDSYVKDYVASMTQNTPVVQPMNDFQGVLTVPIVAEDVESASVVTAQNKPNTPSVFSRALDAIFSNAGAGTYTRPGWGAMPYTPPSPLANYFPIRGQTMDQARAYYAQSPHAAIMYLTAGIVGVIAILILARIKM